MRTTYLVLAAFAMQACGSSVRVSPDAGSDSSPLADGGAAFDASVLDAGKFDGGADGEIASTEVRLRLFTPAWRGIGGQTPAEVARRFAIIIGGQLDPAAFHAGDSDAVVLQYQAGPYAQGDPRFGTPTQKDQMLDARGFPVSATDPGGLARFAYGPECGTHHSPIDHTDPNENCIIRVTEFPTFWLTLPDSPEWHALFSQFLEGRLAAQPSLDGVFIDSLGTAAVDQCLAGYVDHPPIDPATGQPFCASDAGKRAWLDAQATMLVEARRVLEGSLDGGVSSEPRKVAFNGLGSGSRYWAEPGPRVLLDDAQAQGVNVFAAMSEAVFRQQFAPVWAWPSLEVWQADIAMVEDLDARGISGLWWTKCWGADHETCLNDTIPAESNPGNCGADGHAACTVADLAQRWRIYALASYLLAAGPHSYFNYDEDKLDGDPSMGNSAEWHTEYDAANALGAAAEGPINPLTPLPGSLGIFRRAFSGGVVILNADAERAPALDLGGTFYDLSGAARTSMTLEGHSAAILRVAR